MPPWKLPLKKTQTLRSRRVVFPRRGAGGLEVAAIEVAASRRLRCGRCSRVPRALSGDVQGREALVGQAAVAA